MSDREDNMLGDRFQHADWKKEKHVPVIECPDEVAAGEMFDVKASLGKEIAHPNTTEHHIRWITLFFHPEGGNFTYEVGHFEFNAHGESVQGPNEGPVYTHHSVTASMKISEPGTLYALALCNIHGLWESSKEIRLK
jgi:superoxide reductase